MLFQSLITEYLENFMMYLKSDKIITLMQYIFYLILITYRRR